MQSNDRRTKNWTLGSIAMAVGSALAGMMAAMQLMALGVWPDVDWSFLVVPAIAASAFLVLRHPGTGILTTFVFFPLLLFLMFYATACLPVAPVR